MGTSSVRADERIRGRLAGRLRRPMACAGLLAVATALGCGSGNGGSGTAPAGTMDAEFNGTGFSTVDFGGDDHAIAVAIQPSDGKIVVAGYGGDLYSDVLVTRLEADGSRDRSFGDDGRVFVKFPDTSGGVTFNKERAYAVAVAPDRRIVVAGSARFPDLLGGRDGIVARLMPDGSLDPSFGGDGRVVISFPEGDSEVRALVVTDGGVCTVVGSAPSVLHPGGTQGFVQRLNGAGALLPIHDYSGVLFDTEKAEFTAVALAGDGKAVCGGYVVVENDAAEGLVARQVLGDGWDVDFGGSGADEAGSTLVIFPEGYVPPMGLALRGDGKILLSGTAFLGTTLEFGVSRLRPEGSVDSSFGVGGHVSFGFTPTSRDLCLGMALQRDGKILLVGDTDGALALARLTPDGALDPGFADGGLLTSSSALASSGAAVTVQADGRIVVVGSVQSPGGDHDFVVLRFHP